MATGERLPGPERVRKLQTVLHAKAKEEPERRFHALVDKVWREDFLAEAWRRVRRNGGLPGWTERPSRTSSDTRGALAWGTGAIEGRAYAPPVRQVLIPKDPAGRPLGIPCVRDRVAQTSALRLEHIRSRPATGAVRHGRGGAPMTRATRRQTGAQRGGPDLSNTSRNPACRASEELRGISDWMLKRRLEMPRRRTPRAAAPHEPGAQGTERNPEGSPISPLAINL